MNLPPQIIPLRHAGHDALRLTTRHGAAIIALHGAHLLSWVPAGQREVIWLSPEALPEPAPIRGGVPVCWPWFARQGMPASALQHGPARVVRWQVSAVHTSTDEEISLSLVPAPQRTEAEAEAEAKADADAAPSLAALAPGLQVSLRFTLNQSLRQQLMTRNEGPAAFQLTQALHSYFSVSHANQVSIEGLLGLAYQDKLRGMAPDVQQGPFALGQACDRIYHHAVSAGSAASPAESRHCYTLADPLWQRRIVIETEGSASVVVWNPGSDMARQIVDIPHDGWPDFFCIEAANAGPNAISLAPGAHHQLAQTLRII